MQKLIFISLLFGHFVYPTHAQSNIGFWEYDNKELPYFTYTGALPYVTPNITDEGFEQPEDPYFLLGNHRFTVFQHVSGNYQLLAGERAWAVVNKGKEDIYASTSSILTVDGKAHKLTGEGSLAFNQNTKKQFGSGYAQFQFDVANIAVTRSIAVKPSEGVKDGTPALLVSVEIENKRKRSVQIEMKETILGSYKMNGIPPGAYYLTQSAVNKTLDAVKTNFTLASIDPYLVPSKEDASHYDVNPPVLYLKNHTANGASVTASYAEIDSTEHNLSLSYSLKLKAGEIKTIHFVVGYEYEVGFEEIDKVYSEAKKTDDEAYYFQNEWRTLIPTFAAEKDEVLKREMQWNSYVLQAMMTYMAFYDEVFIPQGMAYDYGWGMSAAYRDHAQSALPLCYQYPKVAKSIIRFILKRIRESGDIPYTNSGYGITSNETWNTSDQQLYFFFLLGEYLRITKDYDILTEETAWLPIPLKSKAQNIEKVRQAFYFLRDEIGFAANGLVRLMNSDWNDLVFFIRPANLYHWTASSHLNSTMATVVMKNLTEQLQKGLEANDKLDKKEWDPLIRSIEHYTQKVKTAVDADLEGKPYSYRGYLDEETPFGHDNMYLEPQPWILLREDVPVERKKGLYKTIKSTLMEGEVLGARHMEKSLDIVSYKHGVSENGAFWYSLNSPLLLGVNTFDPQEAKRLLKKMTFENYSKAFPDYWVGQWSNDDCVNSTLSDYPGLSRSGTEWTTYPIYCSHPHAWPIYCYYRLKEKD